MELVFRYTGIENLVLGGGFLFDNEGNNVANETDVINIHAAYETGKFLIGVEYSEANTDNANGTEDKRDAYMFLADYTVNEKLGVSSFKRSN